MEPTGSNRDFVRYLVAVSEAGVAPVDEPSEPMAAAVRVIPLERTKGLEFSRVYVVLPNRASIIKRLPRWQMGGMHYVWKSLLRG